MPGTYSCFFLGFFLGLSASSATGAGTGSGGGAAAGKEAETDAAVRNDTRSNKSAKTFRVHPKNEEGSLSPSDSIINITDICTVLICAACFLLLRDEAQPGMLDQTWQLM